MGRKCPARESVVREGINDGLPDLAKPSGYLRILYPQFESGRRLLGKLCSCNVYVAEGPASLSDAGSAFTKYVVAGM